MKLDNTNSGRETMNQIKRDKSVDIKETKERLKQEKLQKEKEKKEKEKQEKERKEREKKEKKEREKAAKKGASTPTISDKNNKQSNAVPPSSTTSALNKFNKQDSGSTSELGTPSSLPSSKSENVLSKLRKNNDSKWLNRTQQQPQAQQSVIPKGRYRYQVVYLDETVKTFDVDKHALGEDLMTLVCQDLELIEKEYFSLTYRDVNNMKFWLDLDKKIKDQLKGNVGTAEPVFNFEVKFYPPEPNVLQEEITRYLLTLQLRHDIMDGKLPCTFVTHALLGSYTVQAELGDYDELTNATQRMNLNSIAFDYLEGFCFAPNQTPELLQAIANCHKDNKGQAPSEAELHYLENAVKLAMYGVDLHNAKDSDGVDILVGVSASGLLVFRDHLRINRFAWPKILKISYKRNHFYLKLRPSEFEKYETTIGFRCPNHKAAKRLWKIAVEHHAFFRLREPEKPTTKSRLIPNFNANFRYTGSSTYMQSRHRSIERQQPPFTRSLSKRLTQSMDRGLALQNPNETPGSVQSAAFNHFNRNKPHMSTSNIIGDQYNNLRESQEDLEDMEAGDYNVNDSMQQPRLNSNQLQPTPSRQPNGQTNFQQQQPPKINPSFMDRFPKDSANFSNRSNNSSRQPEIYQSINKKSTTMPNFNQQNNRNLDTSLPLNEQATSFEHLDEYYTSVDPNTTPSMKRALADSVASISGSNKISTPILNNNQQQPAQQRYVPSRQINNVMQPRQQQQQQLEDEFDENGNLMQPLPLSPRTQNQSYNQSLNSSYLRDDDVFLPNSSNIMKDNNSTRSQLSNISAIKYNEIVINSNKPVPASNTNNNSNIRDILGEIRKKSIDLLNENQQPVKQVEYVQKVEKLPAITIADSEQVPYSKSPVYKPTIDTRFQAGSNRSPMNSDRIIPNQQQSTQNSYRVVEQNLPPQIPLNRNQPNQSQIPQPLSRNKPIPADRSSVSSRDRLNTQQDYDNQLLLAQQEFEQQKQIQEKSMQLLRQQQQQQFNLRQPILTTSSGAISREFKTNDTSKSGSNISTPDANRSKKQIVNEVNHKDLLLRAIQMATELDPDLQVEKVEITTEE